MSKHICLYGFLILFVASLSLQYVRARLRKKIIRKAEEYVPGQHFENEWKNAGVGPGAIFGDLKRMRLLKNSSSHLPGHFLIPLRRFRVLSAVELTTTILMLLVAIFAYKICV